MPAPSCGAGPPSEQENSTAVFSSTSNPSLAPGPAAEHATQAPPKQSSAKDDASDVWRFMRALDTDVEPLVKPAPESEQILLRKPKSKFVGCILCTYVYFVLSLYIVVSNAQYRNKWQTWKLGDGRTKSLRDHLRGHHNPLWTSICRAEGLKGWDKMPQAAVEPFSHSVFLQHLLEWIASDDQVSCIFDDQKSVAYRV